jgi:hypothetical protein
LTPTSSDPVSFVSTLLGVPKSNTVSSGVTEFDGDDSAPEPEELVAVTVNV